MKVLEKKKGCKKINWKKSRAIISMLLIFLLISSSIKIAFADQDIEGLLTAWFHKKKAESITEIDSAIKEEQKRQTDRLKEVIQVEIEKADQRLKEFTEKEKAKRVERLRKYTDQLIEQIHIDDSDEKERIISELETIFEEAKAKMDQVVPNGQESIEEIPKD